MKKTLALFLLCLCANVYAQKLRMDMISPYIAMYPEGLLPASHKTYSVSIERNELPVTISNEELASLVTFRTLSRVEKDADVIVKVYLGYFSLKTELKSYPDKDYLGKPTTKYEYEKVGTNPIVCEVHDRTNRLMYKFQASPTETLQLFASGKFATEPEAKKASLPEVVKVKVIEKVKELLKGVSWNTRKFFEIHAIKSPESYWFYFARIKPSKEDKMDDFVKIQEDATKIIETSYFVPPHDSLRTLLKPAMDSWEKEMGKNSPTDKEQKNMYFACAYNLSIVHNLLQDFENAEKYIALAEKTDLKDGFVKMMRKTIEARKNHLNTYNEKVAKANAGTYEFYISAKGGSTTQGTAKTLEVEKGYVVKKGGDTLFCNFLDFNATYAREEILNVMEGDKPAQRMPIKELTSVSTNGIVFDLIEAELATPKDLYANPILASPNLLIRFYASPNIRLYFWPATQEYVFFFPKTGKYEKFVPLMGDNAEEFLVNYNKRLAPAFSQPCPQVEKKILDKVFDLKRKGVKITESLTKVVIEFEKDCGCGEADAMKYLDMVDPAKEKLRYK